jgi:hypothetical protein
MRIHPIAIVSWISVAFGDYLQSPIPEVILRVLYSLRYERNAYTGLVSILFYAQWGFPFRQA